jgi:hypothetical protein
LSLLLTFSAWPADSEDLTLSDQLLSNLEKPLHLCSLQQVKRLASSYEFIPLDRFLLWFHPDGRTVTLDQFDGLANSVYKLLRDGKMEGDLPGEGRDHHDKFAITLAAALKLIRYKHQFPPIGSKSAGLGERGSLHYSL